jgi:hypothetical protein
MTWVKRERLGFENFIKLVLYYSDFEKVRKNAETKEPK